MEKLPIKMYIYTFMYNNFVLLPYIIQYWKQYATKVIIYDNMSPDGAKYYLEQYDWIEIREYDSNEKYDKNIINQIKQQAWKECRNKGIDYVMVCSIDNVLYHDNIMNILQNYKNKGYTICKLPLYECLNKKLPGYNNNIYAHEFYESTCILNTHKNAIIFNPDHIHEINFNNIYKSVGNIKQYFSNDICALHLKLFGLNVMSQIIAFDINRYNKKDMTYGYDLASCTMAYNNIYNTRLYTKILNVNKKTKAISKINTYKDVQWENTKIIHGQQYNNDCIIMIPIYKQFLSKTEDASLRQVIKILGNSYELCICCPFNIFTDYYTYKYNYNFSYLQCNNNYFVKQMSYSWLCEEAEWYKCFQNYKFMLIYQLDGWIFKNEIDKFVKLDYDYIGSPWRAGINSLTHNEMVGNGGISLRKIETFINICTNLDLSKYNQAFVNLEDLLFCHMLKDQLNIAPVKDAIPFCVDQDPEYWYNKNNKQLPMATHGWEKFGKSTFWNKNKFINL